MSAVASSFNGPPIPTVSPIARTLGGSNSWFVEMIRRRLVSDSETIARCARVSLSGQTLFLFDTERGRASLRGSERFARFMLQRAITSSDASLSVESIDDETFDLAMRESASVPLLPMLWRAGRDLDAQSGPMRPLDIDSRIRMTRWPDFRVMAHRHDDFRICSLLMKRSCDVKECAELLGLDTETIQSFFNASYLTGYASLEEGARPRVIDQTPSKRNRSLLADLWRGVRSTLTKRIL